MKSTHNYNIVTSGKLVFEPDNVTKKHARQAGWKRTAVIMLDEDISRYYAWFIRKRYNIPLSEPFRGTHLTIIADKVPNRFQYDWMHTQYNGKAIEVEFATDVRTDGHHWWLPARCVEAEDIREKCGLERDPFFAFHITIGNVYERYVEHSEYISDLIVKYGDGFL